MTAAENQIILTCCIIIKDKNGGQGKGYHKSRPNFSSRVQ
jgi:hypothetical protein